MNTEARRAMLEARRIEQSQRAAGIVKRNGTTTPRQRPLAMPKLRTGKQYTYAGRR